MEKLHPSINLFTFPARSEYFIRLRVRAMEFGGEHWELVIHTNPTFPQNKDEIDSFCDKVRVNETLYQAVCRSLYSAFGIVKVESINTEFISEETAHNRFGELLPRYVIDVTVRYQPLKTDRFQNLYVRWIPVSKMYQILHQTYGEEQRKSLPTEKESDEIVENLEQLHYFKYVSFENLSMVKEKVKQSIREYGTLEAFQRNDQENLDALEKRMYFSDQENLAEGSVSSAINRLKPVLQIENVFIESLEDDIDYEGKYNIVINGKQYEIYNDSNIDRFDSWTIAHKRLLEIVNELLQGASSKERLYGQYTGNDGRVFLLTEELFFYIKSLPLESTWIPYDSEELNIEI